jgi:hypothetical protein
MFLSSNIIPHLDNLKKYDLSQPLSPPPFKEKDLGVNSIINRPFGNSPVSNIDNSTPPHVGSKNANGDNVYINRDDNQVVTELFPISPYKTPPTTPLNSPGAPSTKQSNGDYYNGVSSPVPMHPLSYHHEQSI